MSGAFSIPNTFASAVTATGAQLDADFNTITAYINDPTNRNNYAADTGSTNTVAIAFTPAVVGGYTAGLEITFKAAFTNTGAVVVNANTLGNQNLVNPDGTNLSAGQLVAGSIGKAVYDGTRFIFISSGVTPASAAQVSAAATLVPYVSPGRMQNHPGVAKAWAYWNGTVTGTITALASHNVATIVRIGLGTHSIALTTTMSSTAWAPIVTVRGINFVGILSQDATSVVLLTRASDGTTQQDSAFYSFVAYGNQ